MNSFNSFNISIAISTASVSVKQLCLQEIVEIFVSDFHNILIITTIRINTFICENFVRISWLFSVRIISVVHPFQCPVVEYFCRLVVDCFPSISIASSSLVLVLNFSQDSTQIKVLIQIHSTKN